MQPLYHYRLVGVFVVLIAIQCGGVDARAQIPTRAEVDAVQSVSLPEDPAAIIAVVGQTPIFLGEISPKVEARINEVLAKANQSVPEDQLKFARINLTRGMLTQAIQNKMMRESFLLDQVGTQSAEKRAEADETLAARARQMFHESELPQLKKQYKANDMSELDALLRQKGSSLAARQRDFTDAMLGHLYIRSKVNKDPTVSLADITQYYNEHQAEYRRTAMANWEQLTVLHSNFSSRDEAIKAISDMGREAYFGGNVQAVARAKSQEPFASSGGLHDWTAKGSLASEVLDAQIFSLPLNALSEIIEDETGFHIIRVLGRKEAGFTPLSEVQDEIRAKIREQKIAESQKNVMKEMQLRVQVWSLFPDDIEGAKPLPSSIASRPSATPAAANRF
ncbi:Peptidyl-prolyl cis-trans isomerase D [Novipirellula galeiformis]|uniref:Periplasmic chaperone PpiD n=1 Tax=Novipirellula galeiformis TaxID=2528004 RepID=A0A5C6BTL0_9BACT|nr:peptidyl-prolyl cis-trans isomerase [Novipirellula galeiformis]TWU15007.1 Peptidyl-prolyl cis-trans isomerase D [Novipirellula galeiformis]